MTEQPRVGFFGKLPIRGDFITRRLPRDFTAPWDQWLQNAVAHSRERLGSSWLEHYLVSPIWRFVLSPDTCGPRTWGGVLMPSVDRVGRYFPLTLAVPLMQDPSPLSLVQGAEEWFTGCENLALAVLNEEIDLEEFDAGLSALKPPAPEEEVRYASPLHQDQRIAWELPLPPAGEHQNLISGLGDLLLRHACTSYSLWWSRSAADQGDSLLVSQGLPPVERYAGMLDGKWTDWGWSRCLPIKTPVAGVGAEPT